MKKILSVLLSFAALFVFTGPAYAAEFPTQIGFQSEIRPMYTDTSALQAGLSINSSGKTTCSGTVVASKTSYKTALTVELQQKSGRSWTAVTSWDISGANKSTLSKSYYVDHGTYRVCVKSKVYNASGTLLESLTQYSNEKTY